MAAFAFATDPRLTPAECRVAQGLLVLAGRHPEVWHSTETIAAAVHLSVSTVKAAIRTLIRCGYVARVRDYALRTRRRLVLLWRGGDPAPLFPRPRSGPETDPRSGPETDPHPPDPPEEVLRATTEPDGGATGTPPPRASEPAPAVNPADVAELVPKARAIVGSSAADDPSLGDRLAAFLRRWGKPWLSAALDRAAAKARSEPLANPYGYLNRTLLGYQAEGGPPPAGARPASAPAVCKEKAGPTFQERWRAMQAARKGGLSP